MNKKLYLLVIALLMVGTKSYSIDKSELDLNDQNSGFSSSFIQLGQIFFPFLPHTSLLSGNSGFSVSYMYPGFYSGMTGQVDFSYTTSSEDSYHFGIGYANLIIGINKKITDFNQNSIYLNAQLGRHGGGNKEFLHIDNLNASIGLSNRITGIKKKMDIEFAIDGFFYSGGGGDWFPFIPYNRGIVSNVHFSHTLFKKLIVSYGIGFGFVQYRFDAIELEEWINSDKDYNQQCYISYRSERLAGKKWQFKEREPMWDNHLIFPFGCSVSYRF